MPGDREISTTLVAAKIAVASRPASAANLEARITVMITAIGAKNGTIKRIENGPFVWLASHQVGLPTASAEVARAINEPAIKRCVTTTATAHDFVSVPARSDWL